MLQHFLLIALRTQILFGYCRAKVLRIDDSRHMHHGIVDVVLSSEAVEVSVSGILDLRTVFLDSILGT